MSLVGQPSLGCYQRASIDRAFSYVPSTYTTSHQSQHSQPNKINNIGARKRQNPNPVVYARNREGGPRSVGESFSENPLKSAQKRSKNVSPRDGVTPSQQRVLVALAEARSIVAAARTAGVGESSIRRWLREDERFQTKLRQLREEALSQASLRLQQGASRAVETMLELIASEPR